MPNLLTKSKILLIPKLKKQGMTTEEIARRFRVSARQIRTWSARLREASYNVPKDTAGRKKIEL